MKRLLSGTALAAFIGLYCLCAQAKPTQHEDWSYLQPNRDQVIASLNIVELLKRHHYNKPPLNDARSAEIYASFLKMLDPNRSYFIATDIDKFNIWRDRFDDLLKTGNLEPGFEIYRTYLERVEQRLDFVLALLDKGVDSFDFKSSETLRLDREEAPWARNEKALDAIWRKRLKDEILRLKLTGKTSESIQETLGKRYRNQLSRLRQTRTEDVFQTYINAFAQSYDPHTQYLSPENAENFDINMSLSLEGIGAVLQSDNDYVQVVRLVPAGPAEKGKQLAPADKIIGVGQEGEEMVDVVGWRLDEVVKLIRGPKGSVVRLEVIPSTNAPNDETSKTIAITRDAVKLEEQAAKKSILHLEQNGHAYKVGVIEIPTFYLDFKALRAGDSDYKSTTRDVRKLIAELEADKVDGLVIDLRNNGGGSLQEATEMTGLFVDEGPAVLVRNSDGRVDILSDDSTGMAYSGPMAVLVNRLSASASEIFAGAMQDYHRALIVGGQTFGKGTVQSIQPLNHGELKLTLAKFYRVSGQSTQHQGVIPDISYPASMDTHEIGESTLPQAMPWDSIRAVVKPEINPFRTFLAELKSRHEDRTHDNPDFVYTRDRLMLSQELMKEKTVPLNEVLRRERQAQIEQRQLALENALRKAKGKEPLKKLDIEEDPVAQNADEEQKPEDDAYLAETGRILLDYLQLSPATAQAR